MTRANQTKQLALGDLVAAAYDRAEIVTTDPGLAAEMAARTTARLLARADRLDLLRALAANTNVPRGPKRTSHARPARAHARAA